MRVVVMHYIPDSQKNAYLREISTLAKAIQGSPGLGEMSRAKDLGDARHRLIDLLTAAIETALPDAKARMIQLEARQAVAALAQALPSDALASLNIIPLSIIVAPSVRPLVLSQDREIAAALEADTGLSAELAGGASAARSFDRAGHRVVTRSVSTFQPDRLLYDCIAVKLPGIPQQKKQGLESDTGAASILEERSS